MFITQDEEGTIMVGEVRSDTPEDNIVRVEIECDCGGTVKVIGLRDSVHWNPHGVGASGLVFRCSNYPECSKAYIVKPNGGYVPHKRRGPLQSPCFP